MWKRESGCGAGRQRSALLCALTAALLLSAMFFVPVNAHAESPSALLVEGRVTDRYGVPVPWFLVGYENLRTGTGEVRQYEGGAYALELTGVEVGDIISINFTDGKCFYHTNVSVDTLPMKVTLDVILDPPMEMPSDGGVHPDVGGAPRVMRAHLPERPSLPEPTNWTWENATEGDNENASIVLTDIRAPPYFRLAFTGKRNRLKITLANIDTHKYIVRADIYEIGPDGVGKTYLRTLNYGCIKPGRDKTRQMWWTPTETGRNWIYGEIYVKERHGNRWLRAGHFRESFNVVPGWREVVEIDGDYVVSEPTVIDNVTLIVHGDIYANAPLEIRRSDVIAGNLTVSDITTIYGDSSVDIAATYDGQYKVEVMPSGTLEVYGKIWNNPDTVYYNFWMNGTLLIDKDPYAAEPGVVENVNGNATDLSAPGGVVCIESNGTVTIRNGGTIRNGKTHGLYLYRTDAFLIGANISNNGGYGLYAVESAPVINNSLFQNNRVAYT
jgi:hypothetical protein